MTRILVVLALFLMLAAPAWAEEAAASVADKAVASADALDQKSLDDKALIAWAAASAADTMTFDYKNFQQRFLSSSRYFTKTGWETFSAVMKNSGTFDEIRKKNESLSAEATATPEIRKQGAVDGKYRWTVSFPLAVHYHTDDDTVDATRQVTLIITRVPGSDSAEGVQIAEWVSQ